MKKIILTIAALVALEGLALAGTGVPAAPFSFKPSNNVSVYYATDQANASGQAYLVNTRHSAGDRVYSSTNATSNIWYKTATASGVGAEGLAAGESVYSGWSSQ